MRVIVVALLVSLSLAGCSAQDSGPEADSEAPDVIESTPDVNGTVNETVNLVPVLNITATELNGTAPWLVQFNLTVEDDSNMTAWNVTLNGVEFANGTATPALVNLTLEVGEWNATFNVYDGEHHVNQSFLMTVLAGGPSQAPVTVTDAGSDGSEYTEITQLVAQVTDTHLQVVLTLDAVWPSTSATSAATYSLNVGGRLYNSFVRYPIDSNPMTWDNTAGEYMASGTSTWTGTTVTFNLPLDHLSGNSVDWPFGVFATANYGALNNREVQDRVPDSGRLTVG